MIVARPKHGSQILHWLERQHLYIQQSPSDWVSSLSCDCSVTACTPVFELLTLRNYSGFILNKLIYMEQKLHTAWKPTLFLLLLNLFLTSTYPTFCHSGISSNHICTCCIRAMIVTYTNNYTDEWHKNYSAPYDFAILHTKGHLIFTQTCPEISWKLTVQKILVANTSRMTCDIIFFERHQTFHKGAIACNRQSSVILCIQALCQLLLSKKLNAIYNLEKQSSTLLLMVASTEAYLLITGPTNENFIGYFYTVLGIC